MSKKYMPFTNYNNTYVQKSKTAIHIGPSTIFKGKLSEDEVANLLNSKDNTGPVKFQIASTTSSVREISNAIKNNLKELEESKTILVGDKEISLESKTPIIKSLAVDFNSSSAETKRTIIQSSLGTASYIEFPLYHSGFWLKLNTPSNIDLLELYRKIESDKISFLEYPITTVFNNIAKRETILILNFIKEYVRSSSLNVPNIKETLFNHVSVLDIPILINYMASLIWKDGFRYITVCENEIKEEETGSLGQCGAEIEAMLDFQKIHYTDFSKLSEEQLLHMSKKQNKSVSVEEVNKYRESLQKENGIEKFISDNEKLKISVDLKICNVSTYIDFCELSNSRLETTNNKLLSESPAKRAQFLRLYIKSEMALSYFQYIKNFTMHKLISGEDETKEYEKICNFIPDLRDEDATSKKQLEDAFLIVEEINNSDEITNFLNEKIAEFVSNSIISVIARPPYKCPVCDGMNGSKLSDNNYLGEVAINPASIFLESLGMRVGVDL